MFKYKKYPSYKDSGVEWLGEIPEHWGTPKLKLFIATTKGFAFKSDSFIEEGIPVIKMTEIKNGTLNKSSVFLPKSFQVSHKQVLLNEKDIIVSTVGSAPEVKNSAVGQIGIVPKEHQGSLLNQNTVIFSPIKELLSNDYLPYILKSQAYREHLDLHAHGTANQASLNLTDMLNFIFPFQPLKEQQQIAKFLDNATQKMDTLIKSQERLIELLKEKRQAVISHAVTKGLNPDVKFKDSGVEWLGDIPEHWNLPKIKYFALTDSGGTPTSTNRKEYYDNGIYPWIRTTDLNNSILFSTPIKITQKAINDTACNLVKSGSVLIGMYGGAGTIGKHSLLKFTATINQAVCSITPNRNVISEYLHYFIQFYRPYWMIGAMGTRKDPNIGQDTINNRNVPIPPFHEQQEIANYLDDKTKKIDTLIKKSKKSIKLLNEKITALISSAVTGKIDVRELVS